MTNTSGKVTVSREVAETIDTILLSYSPEEIIEKRAKGAVLAYPELLKVGLDTLIRALYIGYEVEKSPEEEMAEFIAELRRERSTMNPFYPRYSELVAVEQGARKAAEILGVKLPERTDAN